MNKISSFVNISLEKWKTDASMLLITLYHRNILYAIVYCWIVSLCGVIWSYEILIEYQHDKYKHFIWECCTCIKYSSSKPNVLSKRLWLLIFVQILYVFDYTYIIWRRSHIQLINLEISSILFCIPFWLHSQKSSHITHNIT